MGLGYVFDDGKPQACASHSSASGLIDPIKTLEESGQMLLFYAAALVADTDADVSICLYGLDQNRAPLIAEFYRIVDEVHNSLLQKGGVDVGHQFIAACELKCYLFGRCLDLTDLDGCYEDIPDAAYLKFDVVSFGPALDP